MVKDVSKSWVIRIKRRMYRIDRAWAAACDGVSNSCLPNLLAEGEEIFREARKIRANGYALHMTSDMRQHHRNCMRRLAFNLIVFRKRLA